MDIQINTPIPTSIHFGHMLRMMREKAEMTQVQFAKQINYSPTFVSRLESGKRKPNYKMVKNRIVPVLAEHNDETDMRRLLILVLEIK